MGVARRGSASLGSIESVADDLRIVRSIGGFGLCAAEHVAGTRALLAAVFHNEPDVYEAIESLEEFALEFLNRICADPNSVPSAVVPALALTAFFTGTTSSMESVRLTVGNDARNVRGQEDTLIVKIATAFVRNTTRPRRWLGSNSDATRADNPLSESELYDYCLVTSELATSWLSLAVAERRASRELTDEFRVALEDVLAYTARLHGLLDRYQPQLGDGWRDVINQRMSAAWISPLNQAEHVESRKALMARAGGGSTVDVQLRRYLSSDQIDGMAQGVFKDLRRYRRGIIWLGESANLLARHNAYFFYSSGFDFGNPALVANTEVLEVLENVTIRVVALTENLSERVRNTPHHPG